MLGFDHPETTKTWDALYYNNSHAIQFYDSAINRMLKLLDAKPSEVLLDAGCGAGVHAIRAAERGYRVDAIDFSEAALEDAKKRAASAGVIDRVHFMHEDLTRLSFADSAYSRIFSWGVLIHIPRVAHALDELVRVLSPGGRLALYLCNASALQFGPRRIETWLKPNRAKWKNLDFGYATEFELHGNAIWLWHFHHRVLDRYLSHRGLTLVARDSGEFSDLHIRFPKVLGRLCWRFNNLWCLSRLPSRLAQMNLSVYEKSVKS